MSEPTDPKPEAWAYIQWAGTDVSLDIACVNCHQVGHFDGYFAYELRCSSCGQLHKLDAMIGYRTIDDDKRDMTNPPVIDMDDALGIPLEQSVVKMADDADCEGDGS